MTDVGAAAQRGFWRLVVRPLAEQQGGPVVCDAREPGIPEGILAVTRSEVHAVAPCEALASLVPAYTGRLQLHASPADAWPAAPGCRLAVLDARCELPSHVKAIGGLAASGAEPPAVLLHGIDDSRAANGAGDALVMLGERGFQVVELAAFPHARLMVPAGSPADHPCLVLASRVDATTRGHAANGGGNGSGARTSPVATRTDERAAAEEATRAKLRRAEQRVAAAETGRHVAEAQLEASRSLIETLRRFNDDAGAQLRRAHEHVEDLRRSVEQAAALEERARTEARVIGIERNGLREERSRLLHEVEAHLATARATRADLVRVRASHAWRVGHALTRLARVLTFRRPGRTDAVSKAIDRLDAASPTGRDQRT